MCMRSLPAKAGNAAYTGTLYLIKRIKKTAVKSIILIVLLIPIKSNSQMISNMIELGFDEKIVEYYKSTAKPTAKIKLIKEEFYEQLGNSRIGGYPDLPEGIEYPTIEEKGEKLHYVFIAQINLEELPKEVVDNYPNKGILYFFIHNDDETMSKVRHQVIYSGEDISNLKRFTPPLNIKYTGESYDKSFKPYSIQFELEESIDLHHLQVKQYELFEQNEEMYDVFERVSRFGGHHFTEDTYLPAQIIREKEILPYEESFFLTRGHLTGKSEKSYLEANKIHIDYYEKKIKEEKSEAKIAEYKKSIAEIYRKDKLEKKLRIGRESYYQELLDNWNLMLVVDSLDECEMLWWDASSLEFFINLNDLKIKNFANTFCLINH